MSIVEQESMPLVLSYAGILAAVAGTLFLGLELRFGRATSRPAAGILSLLLLATAGALWLAGWPANVAALVLLGGIVCLLAWGAHAAVWPSLLSGLAQAKVLWGGVLVAGILAAYAFAFQSDPPTDMAGFEVSLARVELQDAELVTDRGNRLRPFNFQVNAGEIEAVERLVLSNPAYRHGVIRRSDPNLACNCHGWVFTGGQMAVFCEDVDKILQDNGYTRRPQPQVGDLIVYRSHDGLATHTGMVRVVDERGAALIESKWGPLGVFYHPIQAQPYGGTPHYYATERTGHLLRIKLRSSEPAVGQPYARPARLRPKGARLG
ncbi:MAG: hypothetical protein WD872_21600 [Pirellulaceae bacterium]